MDDNQIEGDPIDDEDEFEGDPFGRSIECRYETSLGSELTLMFTESQLEDLVEEGLSVFDFLWEVCSEWEFDDEDANDKIRAALEVVYRDQNLKLTACHMIDCQMNDPR